MDAGGGALHEAGPKRGAKCVDAGAAFERRRNDDQGGGGELVDAIVALDSSYPAAAIGRPGVETYVELRYS